MHEEAWHEETFSGAGARPLAHLASRRRCHEYGAGSVFEPQIILSRARAVQRAETVGPRGLTSRTTRSVELSKRECVCLT